MGTGAVHEVRTQEEEQCSFLMSGSLIQKKMTTMKKSKNFYNIKNCDFYICFSMYVWIYLIFWIYYTRVNPGIFSNDNPVSA